MPLAWDGAGNWRLVLENVHRLMRFTGYRDERKDAWEPARFDDGDCQQKVTAAMLTLRLAGIPFGSMRAYVGGAKLEGKVYDWHAALIVRVQSPLVGVKDFALDHLQTGLRHLDWMMEGGLYRSMKPAMRIEACE